jgi:xanthine/CO dehydrogenase XdhC/CoxF family maturation factor
VRRLFLLGDGAVIDALGDLAGRLRYDEVHRAGEPPDSLGAADDVVVVASGTRGRALLDRILAAGAPGYLGLVATDREAEILLRTLSTLGSGPPLARVSAPAGGAVAPASPEEQAIAIAAELIAARKWRQQ